MSSSNGNGSTPPDFLSVFMRAAGKSEIPLPFLEWSAISLVASTLNDHCWFEKFPDKKLYPQLYVFLLGPSGCLSKDAPITIHRGKRNSGRVYTIADAYQMLRGGLNYARRWDRSLPTQTLCLHNGEVGYREIEEIVYSGVKDTYRVCCANGSTLCVTLDHRIKVPGSANAYKRLDQLKVGDTIMCRSHKTAHHFGNRAVKETTITSIDFHAHEDTYDVKMVGPSHNFLTDDIVVHNCGKGEAIDFALQFIDEDAPLINIWDGKVSGEGFVDDLATINTDVSNENRPTALLVMPELAQAIGKGQQADAFVKRMTGWYPPPRRRYRERTRTTGANIEMASPLVNWLVGTTVDWMIDSITKDAIESGFFARVFAVSCPYDLTNRVTDPTVRTEYHALCTQIRDHLRTISDMEGEFRLTKQAREIRHTWYQTRPAPEDTRLLPSWRRQDDLILKLSMVFSAMSGRGDMRITSREISLAQQYVIRAHKALPKLLSVAGQTPMTTGLNTVADFIRTAERISHSPLLKKLSHRGIHAQEAALHLTALMQQRDIECARLKGGARVYTWAGN
jgi:hypothetical protein